MELLVQPSVSTIEVGGLLKKRAASGKEISTGPLFFCLIADLNVKELFDL